MHEVHLTSDPQQASTWRMRMRHPDGLKAETLIVVTNAARTLVGRVRVQRPDGPAQGEAHADAHGPVAALALGRRLVQLEDRPERLVDALLLWGETASLLSHPCPALVPLSLSVAAWHFARSILLIQS